MARYDVYANRSGVGYLLDVQSDLLDEIDTRIVVPLFPRGYGTRGAQRLNPEFMIEGENCRMMTQLLASVPAHILRAPRANLRNRHDQIVAALDMLFHGF